MAQDKPYRPSNATDGEIFMSRWCADCVLDCYGKGCGEYRDDDDEERQCEILATAFAGAQPPQWIEDEGDETRKDAREIFRVMTGAQARCAEFLCDSPCRELLLTPDMRIDKPTN